MRNGGCSISINRSIMRWCSLQKNKLRIFKRDFNAWKTNEFLRIKFWIHKRPVIADFKRKSKGYYNVKVDYKREKLIERRNIFQIFTTAVAKTSKFNFNIRSSSSTEMLHLLSSRKQSFGGISQDFRASSLELLESSSYAYEKLPLAEHKLLGKNNA